MTHSAGSRIVYRLVAFGFAAMLVSTGIKSVYQIYFSDLASHFGQGFAGLAWAGSVFMLVTGLVSPVVGALSDRFGPLRTVTAGALAAGGGLMLAALAQDSLLLFVAAYGVLGAFGLAAMTYVPMGVLVDRLFRDRTAGLAYAIVTNGTSIGFIVLSPFWLWLQGQANWTFTFAITGLLLAGPVAFVAWRAARMAESSGLGLSATASVAPTSVWSQVRGDVGFYALALGFVGCGATMAFIDVHAVAFWREAGATRAQMGLSLSLLGTLELFSGMATGWLAMRWNKRTLLAVFYAIRSVAMLLLMGSDASWLTIGFAVTFGTSYLGTVVLTSMFCLERYGPAVKGQAFGLLFFAHQVGAFVSVQLGAASHDGFGGYRPLVGFLASLTAAGAVASWFGLSGRPPVQGGGVPKLAAGVE
jgi:MFS family permease